jgi:putative peptidoglycan lipid II flippase
MRLKQLTSGSLIVLLVTIFNRGTGYLRDVLMTAALGASPTSQIFVFVFRVFAVVRALAAETAIPTIVIDRYVRQYSAAKSDDGRAFLDTEWGAWWLLWALWSLILALANPFLMAFLLPSDIYTTLSGWFTFVFSVIFGIGLSTTSVSAVYPSLFQAQGRFFAHSALASLLNIVFISTFLIMLLLNIDNLELLSLQVAVALAVAGLLQIMISCVAIGHPFAAVIWPFQFPRPRRFHLRLAVDTLTQMAPVSLFNASFPLAAILATLVLVQYNLNVTYFFVAERVVQLVPGTVGYAIGIVILPMVASARRNKASDFPQMVTLISVLLVAGGIIAALLHQFSRPVIDLLYQHLNFTAGDALTTSVFLSSIAVSVLPMFIEPVLTNRLFAHTCMWANMLLLTGSIAICLLVWLLREWLGTLLGGGHTSVACAVYVFIIATRVILLIILNVAISYQFLYETFRLQGQWSFIMRLFRL